MDFDTEFEDWMTCEPLAGDGSVTIGLVNDGAAWWPGDMTALSPGDRFAYVENGAFFQAGERRFVVRDLVWTAVPAGARTLYLNRKVLREHVGPEELEAIGSSLFVNGKAFSSALQEEGVYTDPVDFKVYEWK